MRVLSILDGQNTEKAISGTINIKTFSSGNVLDNHQSLGHTSSYDGWVGDIQICDARDFMCALGGLQCEYMR